MNSTRPGSLATTLAFTPPMKTCASARFVTRTESRAPFKSAIQIRS
jgi:hypothetical protein